MTPSDRRPAFSRHAERLFVVSNQQAVHDGSGRPLDSSLRSYGPQGSWAHWTDVPCVVVLADPYMGKTREFKHQTDLARRAGRAAFYTDWQQWHEGANLLDLVDDVSAFDRALSSGAPVTWFVDGLDEGRIRTNSAFELLRATLQILKRQGRLSGLRLRLSCRAAEWRAIDQAPLQSIFEPSADNRPSVVVLRLLSLAESAVRELAAERLPSPDAVSSFMSAMRARNVSEFAGHPLLLALMLDEYSTSGQLGTNRTTIYNNAIERLIRESNPVRVDGQVPTTSLTQLQRIVEDISARLVLGGYARLTRHDGPRGDLYLDAEEVPGTPVEMKAVLETGIFVREGDGSFGVFHRSFAEFLAARRMASGLQADWTLNSILPLFPTTHASIPSPIRETAAWLASLSPIFRGWLIEHDPLTACLGDTACYSRDERLALVNVLVERFKDLDWQNEFDRFGDLAQTLTEGELLSLLDRGNGLAVRLMAINMVESARQSELRGPLVTVAMDDCEEASVRARAIMVLRALGISPYADRLKSLLALDRQFDPNEEIVGAVLHSLYPGHLTTAEALAVLREPREHDVYGLYKLFWSRGFLPSMPATDADRRLSIRALSRWFKGLMSPPDEPEWRADRHPRLGITLRGFFETFVELVRREALAPDYEMDAIGPPLLVIHDWCRRFGESDLHTKLHDLFAANVPLRRELLKWWLVTKPQPGLTEIWHLPYVGGCPCPADIELFAEACDTYIDADPVVAIDAFRELVRVASRFPTTESLERIQAVACHDLLAPIWLETSMCSLDGPVATSRRHAAQAETERQQATDARTRAVANSLEALRSGNVGMLLNVATSESGLDLGENAAQAILGRVEARHGIDARDAVKSGLMLVWSQLDNGERLWPTSAPEPNVGTPLPPEGMAASLGFQLSTAPDADLCTLTDAQIECALWWTLFTDDEWQPTFVRVWDGRPALVWRRIEALLDMERTAAQSTTPRLWGLFTSVAALPAQLLDKLAAYAEAHPLPEHAGVRSHLYTLLWRHRDQMQPKRRVLQALAAHVRATWAGPTERELEQQHLAMSAFAMAWLLEPTLVQELGNKVFSGPHHRTRTLAFLASLTHTLAPSEVALHDWPADVSAQDYAQLLPHLFFEGEVASGHDEDAPLDMQAELVISARNRLVSQLATCRHPDSQSWFAEWCSDSRFGNLREWIVSHYVAIRRRNADEQWQPLTREQRDAVLLRSGTLVRNSDDIRIWLEDLIDRRVAPTFLTDYSLTPLLWSKVGDGYKHLDEKPLQTALYFVIKTQMRSMPAVGAREPEQYQAKKPDCRLSFVLQDGSIVHVPIEIKWSDNDSLWTAPRSQLLGKYMVDERIQHGIYLVGWAGTVRIKKGMKPRPSSPAELCRALQAVADIDTANTGKSIKVHVVDVSRPE